MNRSIFWEEHPYALVLFLGYLLFCLLVGAMWKSRGRPFHAGFFLSCWFTPIIGMTIGLILKPKDKKRESEQTQNPSPEKLEWTCPKCGETNPNNSYRCKKCAYSVL